VSQKALTNVPFAYVDPLPWLKEAIYTVLVWVEGLNVLAIEDSGRLLSEWHFLILCYLPQVKLMLADTSVTLSTKVNALPVCPL
jgi:hypothetical protein